MLGSAADLLRLVAVPVFAWAAYRDVRTRRVPNRTWLPLVFVAVTLLAWELLAHVPVAGYEDRIFLLRTGLSLGFVVPLAYVFWRIGGFGGADAKALMTLAVLFPTFPTYYLPTVALPLERTALGVFSMTVLTNTVLAGLAYPLLLAVRNAATGELSPLALVGRRVRVRNLPKTHGRLFETPEGFTRAGLDLDALRMYLRWRGCSLATLRADPERYRDPASVGATHPPTDGAVDGDAVDGSDAVDTPTIGGERADSAGELAAPVDDGTVESASRDAVAPDDGTVAGRDRNVAGDPWAAERFLDGIDHSAYGTTPETLRAGLAVVANAERERVWVSPGIPFLVPMFVGLVVALTYGDVLFGLLELLGVV